MTISARNERKSVEQALLEVVRQLPDPRVEQLLDFARWLRTQGAQAYDATDMDAAQLERDELAWFNAYQVRRDEFRTMARQAVADFAAGNTTEMGIVDRHKLFLGSKIGLGLAALGRPGYINLGHAADLGGDYDVAAMAANAHAVLDAAWAAGIRYFDAARSYGRAEEFLASWLHTRAIDPAAVTAGSKWGYAYTADWQVAAPVHEVKEHSVARLRQQLAESRTFLNGYLKLYQIHSATLESGVLENQAVLAELTRLRDGGLAIGLSLSGPGQAETLARALDVTIGGKPLFAAVQATWNLLETAAGPMLAVAHAAGMGVIVKEALANGRLTSRNDDPAFARQRRLLEDAAVAQGVTVDALALAAVVHQPWAAVVLSGAATPDQLLANVAALRVPWDDDLAAQLADLAEPPAAYWATRSRLVWN